MHWINRIHPRQVVILWVVGVFLHFLILVFVGRTGGEDVLTRFLVPNLAGIESAQTATVEASLRLERDLLLAQYPDHGWEEIVLAQVRCRFGGRVPEWYRCEASVIVPQVESRIPEPDLNLVALALLAFIGALVPIGLLTATVFWCHSSPYPAWRIARLLGLWLSGIAAFALSSLGWVALISGTSDRLPNLSGRLLIPLLTVTAGIAFVLLRLTWRWFGAKAPSR